MVGGWERCRSLWTLRFSGNKISLNGSNYCYQVGGAWVLDFDGMVMNAVAGVIIVAWAEHCKLYSIHVPGC